MRIRPASAADIPAMHEIRLNVAENRLADPAKVQPRDYEALLAGAGLGWVAELDGRVVGFAIADLASSSVWALFVAPAYEGRGVGRALHDAMLDSLFAAGLDEVWLRTDPGTRADRFYRAAGWRYAGLEEGEARFTMTRARWPGAG